MTGHLPPEIRERIIDLRGQLRPSEADLAEQHIYLTDYVAVDISATDVRRAAAEGRPLAGIVPRRVAEYIAKHQLYQSPL
jgi:nicotinic acid mononucleotide adenylyltransferase